MGSSKVDMKIVLLGKEYGGKTSVVERYIYDRFSSSSGVPYQATIGAAFGAKKIDIGGRCITLGIWDTAGSERYQAMSRIYYRGAKAAIICYDLTDRQSYEKATYWVDELKKNGENCKIYLCGTKKDLVSGDNKALRHVDYHTTTDFADEIGAEVFETSSKTGENIKELFFKIALDFSKDSSNWSAIDENSVQLEPKDNPKRFGCC